MKQRTSKKFLNPKVIGVIVFALAFSAPVVAALYFGKTIVDPKSGSTEGAVVNEQAEDDLFSNVIVIRHNGAHLKAESQPSFEPDASRDFLLSAWFRPFVFPEGEDRILIASKLDSKTKSRSGYALALQRVNLKIRPAVYWRDKEGRGGWYTFSEVEIPARSWFLLVLSFYDQRKLGLHVIHPKADGSFEATLAGGYEFEQPIFPSNSAPFQIGAVQDSSFQGKLGPFGIFKPARLRKKLSQIIAEFVEHGSEIPDSIAKEEVSLFSPNGEIDLSDNKVILEPVRLAKRRTGKQ